MTLGPFPGESESKRVLFLVAKRALTTPREALFILLYCTRGGYDEDVGPEGIMKSSLAPLLTYLLQ